MIRIGGVRSNSKDIVRYAIPHLKYHTRSQVFQIHFKQMSIFSVFRIESSAICLLHVNIDIFPPFTSNYHTTLNSFSLSRRIFTITYSNKDVHNQVIDLCLDYMPTSLHEHLET